MNLIPEWRRAWRMLSVQAMTAAGVLQVAWATDAEAVKAILPPSWVPWVTAGLLVFGIYGRLVKQPKVSDGLRPVSRGMP